MTLETEVSNEVVSEDLKPELNTPEVTVTDEIVEKEQQEEPVKTFTQAEVDAMVQKRLLKEERKNTRRLQEQRDAEIQQSNLVEPRRTSFDNDDEFVQAQIEHLAEVKAAEKLEQRQRATEIAQRTESFFEKAEKVVDRYPDFQTVVSNPDLRINENMVEFIADSSLGAEVAYYLGKNPDKAAHIANLSPIKAARELTSIETELNAKPKPTPSKAPEPINPIGTKGRATTSALPSDDDDIDTWMKKERARMRS